MSRFFERLFFTNIQNHKSVELVGTIFNIRNKVFKLLDYTGAVEVYKDPKLILENGRYAIQCKVYNDNVLYCVNARKISFYEEVYYWIEISKKNNRINC